MELFGFLWDTFVIGFGLYALKKVVYDWMLKRIKTSIGGSPRKTAIWQHYQSRAAGEGHQSKTVLDCGEGHCAVFMA